MNWLLTMNFILFLDFFSSWKVWHLDLLVTQVLNPNALPIKLKIPEGMIFPDSLTLPINRTKDSSRISSCAFFPAEHCFHIVDIIEHHLCAHPLVPGYQHPLQKEFSIGLLLSPVPFFTSDPFPSPLIILISYSDPTPTLISSPIWLSPVIFLSLLFCFHSPCLFVSAWPFVFSMRLIIMQFRFPHALVSCVDLTSCCSIAPPIVLQYLFPLWPIVSDLLAI